MTSGHQEVQYPVTGGAVEQEVPEPHDEATAALNVEMLPRKPPSMGRITTNKLGWSNRLGKVA